MESNINSFDILVVGAGHAGIEAAFICAKKNLKVAMFVLDKKLVANMPCNPSIGGPAKGTVTREIDALGGIQAEAADATKLQIKLLNTSKGAGTWALRAQIDKIAYHDFFIKKLESSKQIKLVTEEVEDLIIEDKSAIGIVANGKKYFGKKIIFTTGTFLNSLTHMGSINKHEGPDGFQSATKLTQKFNNLGIKTIRLKTGTPPRVYKDTVNYSKIAADYGDIPDLAFSHFDRVFLPLEDQLPCHITYTNEKTHEIINDNLSQSAMYNGSINAIGPRYCPSIEDKVVKFADKERHQIFVEPESKKLDTVYLSGFSSSLSPEVQEKILKTLDGFENAVIKKYAYAIEYDAIVSLQLQHTLELKTIKNLFFAGQINGTSGYEEAAAQGLIAGINCICQLENKPPFILKRNESYIGVMIDDLVTKELTEPYRLLTSRAEYRLELRNDNADERLLEKGFLLGLIEEEKFLEYQKNLKSMNSIIDFLKSNYLSSLKGYMIDFKKTNISLYELLKKQNHSFKTIEKYLDIPYKLDDVWKEKLDVRIKYEGYIQSQNKTLKDRDNLIKVNLTKITDYKTVPNISLEAIDKLNKVLPINLDQASRISGINFTDLLNIKLFVEKKQ